MICVSYTRSVSNCVAIESPKNAIGQQNETIAHFMKARGWKLSGKYSDRKSDREDETAFLKMKQDGMDRKFECVVFSSLFYCGKTLTSATDLLGHVFYPAGIHFAVAEDDFCSADVTAEEVDAYIKKIRHEYRARNSSRNTSRYNEKTIYKKYGYVRVGEEELAIDPEPAKIIQRIFRLSCEGNSMKDIAAILNDEGVENAMAYRRRMTGIDYKYGKNGWTDSAISGILRNKVYIGEWRRTINGEDILYSCPPIIDQELFEKARSIIRDRDNAKGKRQTYKGRTLFSKKIVDMETDWPLHVYTLPKDQSKEYRFAYPAPAFRTYDTLYLSCEVVIEEVQKLLGQEQRKVKRAMEAVSGEEGNRAREERIAPLQEQARGLFFKMAKLEENMVSLEAAFNQGELNEMEYENQSSAILAQIAEADSHIQEYVDGINEIKKVFSEKNPWIRHYRDMEEVEVPLTEAFVKKYVGRIKVYRFEQVYLEPYQKEWFDRLPKEWFAEFRED